MDLSALASMNIGMGNMDGGLGFDMETMQKAMQIIQCAGENELTEKQLNELGLTEEQIT